MPPSPAFSVRTIDELIIDDERSFEHVAIYADLKDVLRKARYAFRVMPRAKRRRWDQALLLNLTYWNAEGGGDVLVDEHLPADVVAHVAWHHLAAAAFAPPPGSLPSIDALLLGESIASAFDVYLVGRLLGHAPRSSFLRSQVGAMTEAAEAAGCAAEDFERLLHSMAADPVRAFSELRSLLFDAATGLLASTCAEEALVALKALDRHRFAPVLHHYELANWVLHARAYGGDRGVDPPVRAVDRALRDGPDALAWLQSSWLPPWPMARGQDATAGLPVLRR